MVVNAGVLGSVAAADCTGASSAGKAWRAESGCSCAGSARVSRSANAAAAAADRKDGRFIESRTLLCEASRHKGTAGNVPIVVARTRGLPIMDAMLSVIADSDGFGWRFGHVA
jgi:hypothetical protein